jgi:hypothetical protein
MAKENDVCKWLQKVSNTEQQKYSKEDNIFSLCYNWLHPPPPIVSNKEKKE